MAKRTVTRGIGAYGKEEQTRKSEAQLSKKLQADLESAILRLFESSAYCDVELIVESDSVLAHSCILQARVARFYQFLITECQVLRKNGLSTIVVYNVSFISLRNFVENIYKNVDISKVEECMLQALLGRKKDFTERRKPTKTPDSLKRSNSSHNALTPDADLFYTPKCSPSEIQKPFGQSYPDSPIRRSENDITCYYKIVSVDDVQIDEKGDHSAGRPKHEVSGGDEDEHLEKELAEQDELFLSFKSIFSKVNKSKPSKQPNCASQVAQKKENPRLNKKLHSNAFLSEDCRKPRAKLPLWRPNAIVKDSGGGAVDKLNLPKSYSRCIPVDHLSPRRKPEYHPNPVPELRSHNCEMDVSATGADSGLETSSSCQPEASPRENTVSETSGIDLTEAAINEEIPHDEETISTKPAESINSSSSSDVGTWDANDESRFASTDKDYKTSVIDAGEFVDNRDGSTYDDKDGNCFCRDTLNEEEIARLDAMEKNIRECEAFLDRERQVFYYYDKNSGIDSNGKEFLNHSLNSDDTVTVLESAKDVILQNKFILPGDSEIERENNNFTGENAVSDDNYIYSKQLGNITDDPGDVENFNDGSALKSDIVCKNLKNADLVGRECYSLEETFTDNHLGTLTRQDCESDVYSLSSKEILQVKTPPCSPRQTCKLPQSEKSELIFPEAKSTCQNTVNSYFIDASSLLDEDEFISPPVSLLNFRANDREDPKKEKKEDEEEEEEGEEEEKEGSNSSGDVATEVSGEGDLEKMLHLQEEERRQGDLIFKSSIPHFSRHEVENTEEAMERLRGGGDRRGERYFDDNEQVVPSADVRIDEPSSPPELDRVRYEGYSPAGGGAREFGTPSEEATPSGEPEAPVAGDGVPKRIDAESLPIVSGGLVPEDFSNSSSHISSPHLRRRNESAPILSGGMEYVEEEKKVERKPNVSNGAAWIVSFEEERPRRRRHTATTTTSEPDMESLDLSCDPISERSKEAGGDPRSLANSCNTQLPISCDSSDAKEASNEEKSYQRSSNPIEKSASLGYFIEFSKENEPSPCTEKENHGKANQNAKKNIFSMFIDMKEDKPKGKPNGGAEKEERSEGKEPEIQEEVVKKPFYMFIESDSPAARRKSTPQAVHRRLLKSVDGSGDDGRDALQGKTSDSRRRTDGKASPTPGGNRETSQEEGQEKDGKTGQRQSKLPLPLCKSSSLSSVNADAKMVVWSEKKDGRNESSVSSGETWLRTNDVQVTYKGRRDGSREGVSDGDEYQLKKGSTFVVPEDSAGPLRRRESRRSSDGRGGFHLRTVEEAKSPFKSPEERDSGVIVTEESDDSFVKLSDMDNYKNPYLEGGRHRAKPDAMSQSIPEGGWVENKTFARGGDGSDALMTKSVGVGSVKSNSGMAFPSDKNTSRSLSRLFPNLNLSGSCPERSAANVGSTGNTDPSDTQVSEVSEMSSMQSSMEPSALETSASETDVSYHSGISKLGEDLLRMFLEEISPDVIVEVGGRRMKAHKCILSSRCQYFAAMLSGGWVESAGNVISLQGFDPECYESVEERDILSDIKTKFVPPKYTCVSTKPRRKVRYSGKPLDYEKVYAQVLDRRKRRRLYRNRLNAWDRARRTDLENEVDPAETKRKQSGGKSYKKSKKRNNLSDPNAKKASHPRDGSKTYRAEEDVDQQKEPLGEGEESEQINIGPNYESWLLMRNPSSGEREVFHAFWKGEGNSKSIRKAQTKMMLSFMDPSVDPCQDFYQFACGNWGLKNPIPKDKAGYDTFEMLRESLDIVLQDLLMEEDNDTMNEATIKTKNLYRSCMNNKILEERREKPLLVLLESLGGWPMIDPNWKAENFDWIVLMANLRLYNNDILISEWVGPDIKNSDEYVIQFDQTSLGLPTREYFLEPCNYVYLEAYKNYLIKISTLLGSTLENAKAEAEDLMVFETGLAEITSSPDERRNVSELYERMTIAELSATVPEINWMKYLTIVLNREVDPEEPVVMFALRYVQDLVKLLCQTEPRVVSNYLLWRFIRHRVNNLDDRFQEAKQHFYYILFGREEAPPRWKNCVAQVNTNMGMGLGAMFVARYFDEKSKNDTLEMTHDIMRSFREILNNTSWIDDDTKRLAIQKVDAMMLRIGYPDFILNREALNERYAEVHIDPELYFENTLNILKHLTRAEQDRLGTKVNKSMWNTPPAVVNAYYSRNKNQIMFPAGILQPPFYHRYFPRSLNYGGIGVVIGHEITHGFDDKGRLFDQDGNLHKWWKEPAIEAFHQRAQCLIDQYSKYTVTEVAMQIDGVNTQGENIADNGGIKQAFKAYERWLSIHGDKDEVLQGINATNLQLFFLNFAQIWCGTMRPEATRNKLKTAVHSPGKFRVIGTLSNSEDFARVFQCEPGSPMNPIKKCSVWFSYNAVHFALCHIYSGEHRIPDSLNIVELATLADMLCLEGLKEKISHTLKVKYCHCFHPPCDECHVGVLDCLPVAAAYGLDELYRKCLRWITKHFVRVWPSKTFASLPKELLDKCYQHHVVHMTVENVLDTILNIDTVRGSLPNVRWSETISRLVTKLHDAAVKFIADHFSSILTSDNFLALGKEAGWSVGRLEDSLMKATKRLPPEQACWSHARLHRILTVAKGPDPPSEMDWNGNFIDLLQCISGHVENSLIKQAPRAAKSKAWRQMEPELRSRIQERACLVLPDDLQSPKPKRAASLKRESRQTTVSSSAVRSSSRNLDLRHIKLAITQQVNRTASLGRLQHYEQRTAPRDLRPSKPATTTTATRKAENLPGNAKKPTTAAPEIKKITPSRFMDVKPRYLEPKSPQKTVSDKPANPSSIRRTARPLSSSDSSRNCSPLNANTHGRTAAVANTRHHRDSVVSTESATSYDGKKDRSHVSARSDTPSTKTLSRLTADENMSTDSLFTDSLYSEKDATASRRPEEVKGSSKGKENVRRTTTTSARQGGVPARTSNYSPMGRKINCENSASASNRSNLAGRKIVPPASETKANPAKRFPAARVANVNQRASPGRASLASPRNTTNRNLIQKNATTKYDANVINGNTVKKKKDVDSENNKNSVTDDKRPSTVSRSGTFLKDEPTIMKKPQPAENIESSF